MVNSRLDLFTAPSREGPLLPKLRGYFAEFLNNISHAHLRILSSPTCVGLRYGPHEFSFRSFSRRREISYFSTFLRSPSQLSLRSAFDSLLHLTAWPDSTIGRVNLSFRVTPSLKQTHMGTGISTCYPSTTPFGLALGPDLPRADEPSPGTLRFSMARILTWLSLLMPAFSLVYCPPIFTYELLPVHSAPLPILTYPIASVTDFSPVNYRRITTRPVSYYALFQ